MIPMPPPEVQRYFIRGEDREEYGPVDRGELAEWVREDRAGLGTSVRVDEPNSIWQSWQTFPELVVLLAQQQGGTLEIAAPIWKRLLAWIVDMMLAWVPTSVVLALVLPLDQISQQNFNAFHALMNGTTVPVSRESMICSLTMDAALVAYFAVFHAWLGYTPGKAMMGIRVADAQGHKPRLWPALARAMALLLTVNLFLLPTLWAFFNPRRRTFHDIISGTWVVRR